MLVSVEQVKPEDPKKNPWSKARMHIWHQAAGPESNPGHIGGR